MVAALDDIDGVDLDIAQMGDRIRDGLRPTAERRKRIESLRTQPNTSRPDFAQRIGCLRAGHQRRSLADSGLQEVRKMQRRFAEGELFSCRKAPVRWHRIGGASPPLSTTPTRVMPPRPPPEGMPSLFGC